MYSRQLDTSALPLLEDVDRPDKDVDAVVARFGVPRVLGEDEPVFSSVVRLPGLAGAPASHRGGVDVGHPVLVVLPAVPLALQDPVDGAVERLVVSDEVLVAGLDLGVGQAEAGREEEKQPAALHLGKMEPEPSLQITTYEFLSSTIFKHKDNHLGLIVSP